MSTQLKTPGVYVEEISKLPPSVAQVETAIPAFVGYTEKATNKVDGDLSLVPTRISSLLEYEAIFGAAKKHQIKLTDTAEGLSLEKPNVSYLMYYSLQMYFANGGGPCYVVSAGGYNDPIALGDENTGLKAALNTLEKEDEPTLLVFPDAVSLTDESKFYALYQAALDQANEMGDRFVIMDTFLGNADDTTTIGTTPNDVTENTIKQFRNNVPSDKYGAVYFPHLTTVLNYAFEEDSNDLKISHTGTTTINYTDQQGALIALKSLDEADLVEEKIQALIIIEEVNETIDDKISSALIAPFNSGGDKTATDLAIDTVVSHIASNNVDLLGEANAKKLIDLKGTALYAEIKQLIQAIPVVLPPSATMAGVYATVDSNRGVHKAPANVGLNYVIAPTEKISDAEQEGMNVHADGGKSINAIRTFAGKGTLVWGARTLDGNSNEWRYVPVRRFFNMVEESVQNATERFVFEPNTANTWARVQGMIENFLTQQWKAGALAGATPEQAFYVSVGLNQTMSAQDILEGKMHIEIGMAAVRPAEFIVLKFSHKLQEA